MEHKTAAPAQLGLPVLVVGPVDVGRLVRELEAIDNSILQQHLQKQEPKLPKTSKLMDQLISTNRLNLLDGAQRAQLKQFLTTVKASAPTLHMSFSADPSPRFIEQLMAWLRQNIHPLVLLTVGLQPNIGAGCLVRTNNKYFDFSLNKHFSENRELLMSKLAGATNQPVPPTAAAPAAVPAPAEVQ